MKLLLQPTAIAGAPAMASWRQAAGVSVHKALVHVVGDTAALTAAVICNPTTPGRAELVQ